MFNKLSIWKTALFKLYRQFYEQEIIGKSEIPCEVLDFARWCGGLLIKFTKTKKASLNEIYQLALEETEQEATATSTTNEKESVSNI